MTVTEWGTPDVKPRGPRSKFPPLLEEVRDMNVTNPETWGVIARYENDNTASSTTSTLRKRYPLYEFSAEYRENEEEWFVWARWVGEKDG